MSIICSPFENESKIENVIEEELSDEFYIGDEDDEETVIESINESLKLFNLKIIDITDYNWDFDNKYKIVQINP